MISIIENFTWKNNEKIFSWFYNGKQYEKCFRYVPQSVIKIVDESGFAVVGSYEEFGMHNAFILNQDGSVRYILDIPSSIKNSICFHEIYFINEELTAIIATQSIDFACVFNPDTGFYKKIYETR